MHQFSERRRKAHRRRRCCGRWRYRSWRRGPDGSICTRLHHLVARTAPQRLRSDRIPGLHGGLRGSRPRRPAPPCPVPRTTPCQIPCKCVVLPAPRKRRGAEKTVCSDVIGITGLVTRWRCGWLVRSADPFQMPAETASMPPNPPPDCCVLFDAAVAAAQPALSLAAFLPEAPRGRTVVIGAGKAATTMAQALDAAWPAAPSGVVVTRHGQRHVPAHRGPRSRAPGAGCAQRRGGCAHARCGARARRRRSGDLPDLRRRLVAAGAAGRGLTLADKQAINRALLASGADIAAMNCVRKHLRRSRAAAGGGLRIRRGRDAGDPPTCPATSRRTSPPGRPWRMRRAAPMRWRSSDRYRITCRRLRVGTRKRCWKRRSRTIPCFARCEYHLIATPMRPRSRRGGGARRRRHAADPRRCARRRDRRVAKCTPASPARSRSTGGRSPRPVLLSGGETTVTVRADAGAAGATSVPARARRRARRPSRACTRSPPTPTASTVPGTSPVRCATDHPRPRPRARVGIDRRRASPTTTATASSARSAMRSSPPDRHQRQRLPRDPGALGHGRMPIPRECVVSRPLPSPPGEGRKDRLFRRDRAQ